MTPSCEPPRRPISQLCTAILVSTKARQNRGWDPAHCNYRAQEVEEGTIPPGDGAADGTPRVTANEGFDDLVSACATNFVVQRSGRCARFGVPKADWLGSRGH